MRYTNITMLHKNSYPRRPARHFRKHNKGNKLQTSVLGRVSTMPGRTKCTSAAAKGEFSFFSRGRRGGDARLRGRLSTRNDRNRLLGFKIGKTLVKTWPQENLKEKKEQLGKFRTQKARRQRSTKRPDRTHERQKINAVRERASPEIPKGATKQATQKCVPPTPDKPEQSKEHGRGEGRVVVRADPKLASTSPAHSVRAPPPSCGFRPFRPVPQSASRSRETDDRHGCSSGSPHDLHRTKNRPDDGGGKQSRLLFRLWIGTGSALRVRP